MVDVLIEGGSVAIEGDRIVAVGGDLDEGADEVIDAPEGRPSPA